jgi:hypothetical protein
MRFLLVLSLFILFSCNIEEERYQKEVKEFRAFKDQQMLQSDSPLDSTSKVNFTGLSYFDIDLKYCLELPLLKSNYPSYVQLSKDTAISMVYEEVGHFECSIDNRTFRLSAFLGKGENEGRLFVPFGDATNGSETYGGGRYVYATLIENGRYKLDFNYAHNPFCAYNHEYSCALPPKQNVLNIPIFVGEKKLLIDYKSN